ncbi:MAG: DUF4286 family protein [Phycisphaerales bacterium]|nr:DUF4286 family protein [Phycisphaerales bacterium]
MVNPSAKLIYTVTAECPDEATAIAFLAWLVNGHLADVIRAGNAESAEAVRFDPLPNDPPGAPIRCEARYVFPSRAAFEAYDAGPAKALRAEGAAKFAEARGVQFSRRVGLLVE